MFLSRQEKKFINKMQPESIYWYGNTLKKVKYNEHFVTSS